MAVVLVIDPYEGFREAMSYCLPRFGHSAMVAANGEVALKVASATSVDLVLIDIGHRWPVGFATCEAFKRDVRLQRIPIVLMADVVTPDLRVRSRAAGAEEVVVKPIPWREFLPLLARLAPKGELGEAGVSAL